MPETKKDRPFSRNEVIKIVQSAITHVSHDEENKKLHEELHVLHEYIESMRAELAQMRSIEISHKHIPSATDELDAVVGETAKATGNIMDCCEDIEKIVEELNEPFNNELTNIVTRIYESCSFQDITGQRITKVIKTLKKIENKVIEILDAFGHEAPGVMKNDNAEVEPGKLENGPALGGPSVSQEEIDKLLAEFDD